MIGGSYDLRGGCDKVTGRSASWRSYRPRVGPGSIWRAACYSFAISAMISLFSRRVPGMTSTKLHRTIPCLSIRKYARLE